MSGTIPPSSPFETSTGNTSSPNANRVDTMPLTNDPINTTNTTNVSQSGVDANLPQLLDSRGDKRLKSIIISCLPNDVMKSIIKCKTAKEIWNDLILAHEGPSDIKDTKIAALRLKFYAFKSLEGEKVNGTRLKCLLNDLENNGVIIPQAEVNATFVNRLPRKWLSMNQTQRANNSIKNDCLATLYGKYNYEEGLIDQIYESETQRFTIQASCSKALISNRQFQDTDSDVEEDQRTRNEFMADLNAECHETALLANQKRFYKRSGGVGSARKPLDKSKKTCSACGKLGHFQKYCPSHKTSIPSYPSSNNPFNKSKLYTPSFNKTSILLLLQNSQLLPEMNLKGKTEKSNDMLFQSLRAKFQWLIDQSKKLGPPLPPALATFRMTTEDKKMNRTEFLKEVFVTEDIKVDGMNKNLIPPPRVMPIQGLVINKPESGIFFMNDNMDIAFQRESEFHLTLAAQLIRIQNQIKVNSEIASEMFSRMTYAIEAGSDCIKAMKIVEKNLDNLG
nr:hypothetical protein [Tanacetum cinerariifolium]